MEEPNESSAQVRDNIRDGVLEDTSKDQEGGADAHQEEIQVPR